MTKIIRVEPVENYFTLTWMLGTRCNYDCMYCSPKWHNNTSHPHSLETLKQAWINIYNKTCGKNLSYSISFTGGEVTANQNFLPMVSWLRQEYPQIKKIQVTTNGSASCSYYTKLAKLVESISFSVHSEHINEKKFFNTVRIVNDHMIRPTKSVNVCIMNEHWNQDRIKLYQQFLERHEISYSLNEINYNHQTRPVYILKGKYNIDNI